MRAAGRDVSDTVDGADDDLGKGEIQSPGVRWVDISPEVPIYQPHCAWVYHVVDEMLKVPQIEREMRGLSLKFVFRPVPALRSDPETLRLIGRSSGSDARIVVNTVRIVAADGVACLARRSYAQ